MATATNATTQAILLYLQCKTYKAWRNNNNAVYSVKQAAFRKNPQTLLGVPDIIGFHRMTGKFICIEVKTGKDTLSPEQTYFIEQAKQAGCISIVAKSFDDFKEQFDKIEK